ncbi:hypothetical protein AZI11_04175 [Levilactobacillus brevis]|uniref:host-nuclease inhibitor Gam family protein n=1 Tax=Levilactobacillus brevis TaxID=1580 RepID=UPI000A201C4A|nr:host-nuclease inhibitor Gam family protein [Levilactobacillus brevis]ARN92162.1 hypothetical protein AZI11_04175 [Levilactobacillus brevis]ARN94856.1 hypothetical protein AZI12_04200 [Levilactobacillus brevis]
MDELEARDYEEAVKTSESDETFVVDSLSSASWAVNMIRGLNVKDDEVDQSAEQQKEPYQVRIDEVKQWQADEHDRIQKHREYFENLLADYLFKLREDDPKARVVVPGGKISTRKTPKGLIVNKSQVIDSMVKQGITDELIEFEPKVTQTTLKKFGDIHNGKFVITSGKYAGMTLPGIEPKPQSEKVTFDIKGSGNLENH